MKVLIAFVKWGVLSAVSLAFLLLAYVGYVTATFDMQNLPTNHGQVQTRLFLADGSSQPLIVGLGGAEGGNAWAGPLGKKQRAMLRENGYAFLSVAYFGAEGIPENLDRIALDGIHKAVMDAAQQPNINRKCIAVMGVSRGGELALLLGSYYGEYDGVIGIVPGSAVFPSLTTAMTTPGFSYEGESLPFVPVPWSAIPNLLSRDLRGAFEKMIENTAAMEAAAIKVENINGPVLLISGTRDEQWPSMEMSELMMTRLKDNNFPHHFQHIPLRGGHSEHHDNFDKVISFLNEYLLAEEQSDCARHE